MNDPRRPYEEYVDREYDWSDYFGNDPEEDEEEEEEDEHE